MSIVKSFSVGDGDMFYIQHNSSNFTIIDCNIEDNRKREIVEEINRKKSGKGILRFISTHPDEDHLHGLKYLDENIGIPNFYCVENKAIENNATIDFEYYCELRDGSKHYYVDKGCSRKWMNESGSNESGIDYGNSRINFYWPIINNPEFIKALDEAANGEAFNNLSPVFTYSLRGGATIMWMGDLEKDFLEKVHKYINWPKVDVLFAPHHGRESGRIPSDVLEEIEPQIVVIGEAPSKYLDYYSGYNTITQNSAKDIVFDCESNRIHVYCSDPSYTAGFLKDEEKYNDELGYYIGSITTR